MKVGIQGDFLRCRHLPLAADACQLAQLAGVRQPLCPLEFKGINIDGPIRPIPVPSSGYAILFRKRRISYAAADNFTILAWMTGNAQKSRECDE